MRTCCT